MRILVVDDDVALRDLLDRTFRRDGHHVVAVASAEAARDVLSGRGTDVVVLDLDLPDGSGIDLCQALRREGTTVPILMLTAHSAVANRIASFDSGADDFLAKPFAVAELCARVRALARRRDMPHALVAKVRGGFVLDFSARRASRDGSVVAITPREWSVLEALAHRHGRLLSREELLGEVWGEATDATSASLNVLLTRIRRKISPDAVRTHRGGGYGLELDE